MSSTTPFEATVNLCRGWACLAITLASMAITLAHPTELLFWREPPTFELTGDLGLAISSSFIAYLVVDSAVAVAYRAQFRRSMVAVHAHHVLVGLGTLAFLRPSPPRAFFPYLWGEALTACRVLPSEPRWHARKVVFAGRRVLWIYLIAREVTWHGSLVRWWNGWRIGALLPIVVSLGLLGLDAMWWAEHAASLPRNQSCEGLAERHLAEMAALVLSQEEEDDDALLVEEGRADVADDARASHELGAGPQGGAGAAAASR